MLPKIDTPIFEVKLVSQKQPVKFRPFTVKEEKILLIAEESKDDNDIINAILQVINNCCLSDININKLPLFDIEYFFLQLRAKSVSNISVLKFRDKKDQIVRDFEVDLDQIKPTIDPKHSNTVKLDDTMTVEFKYPSLETVLKIDRNAVDADITYLAESLDKIYQGEQTYDASDSSLEERTDFINSLSKKMFENIIETFIDTMPKLSHALEYVNKEGDKRKILLEGYKSFFPRR
jgi:hypothetical protein